MMMTAVWMMGGLAGGLLPPKAPVDAQQDVINAEMALSTPEAAEGVRILMDLLGRAQPDWCIEFREERRFQGIRAHALSLLLSLPKDQQALWRDRLGSFGVPLRRAKEAEDADALKRLVHREGLSLGGILGQVTVAGVALDEGEPNDAWALLARPTPWEEGRVASAKAKWAALVRRSASLSAPGAETLAGNGEGAWERMWEVSLRKGRVRGHMGAQVQRGFEPSAWLDGRRLFLRHPDGSVEELSASGEAASVGKPKKAGAPAGGGQLRLPPVLVATDGLGQTWKLEQGPSAIQQNMWRMAPPQRKAIIIRQVGGEERKLRFKASFIPLAMAAGEDRLYILGVDDTMGQTIGYGIVNTSPVESGDSEFEGTLGQLDLSDGKGGAPLPGQMVNTTWPQIALMSDDRLLALGFDDHGLMVLDRASGHVRWGRSLEGSRRKRRTQVDPVPVAMGALSVCAVSKGVLKAWDRDTGKPLWEKELDGEAPQVVGCAPGVVVVSTADGVQGYAEKDGAPRWSWKPADGSSRSGQGACRQWSAWLPFGSKIYRVHAGRGVELAQVPREDDDACTVTADDQAIYLLSKTALVAYGPKH